MFLKSITAKFIFKVETCQNIYFKLTKKYYQQKNASSEDKSQKGDLLKIYLLNIFEKYFENLNRLVFIP